MNSLASLGSLFSILGLIFSVVLLFAAFAYKPDSRKKKEQKPPAYLDFLVFLPLVFAVLASIILFAAFLGRHFEFDYVFRYSSSDLPLFYTVTAFWAGQEGSLLLWTLLLSIFTVIFWFTLKTRPYAPKALGLIALVQAFFYLVIVIPASPFKLLPEKPADGLGLNPLLQNLGMVFHPPTVFFAYALFTFPFAIALAVLWTRSFSDERWIRDLRLWTLFAWLFIGIGNVLGALWAYVELGWGGFWAWDPVENASLLPWLTGTAALHSITMYEKRKTLKIWTFIMTFVTFFMCILGTYITRSGTIASVHAFQASPIAGYFLTALLLILVVPLLVLVSRYREIEPTDISNYFSREGMYAVTNWFFSLFTLVVLWGTMFPLISQILTGTTPESSQGGLSVSREFFDTWTSPIMIGIAILIAICPHFAFQKVNWGKLARRMVIPFVLGVAVTLIFIGFWGKSWVGMLVSIIGFTGLFSTIGLFVADFRAVGEFSRFLELFKKNRRRYGGYIAHIGAVLMFIGVFTSTIYKTETTLVLNPGETGRFQDVQVIYEQPVFSEGPNYQQFGIQVRVIENGKSVGILYPSMAYYPASNQQTYEVAVDWGIFRDVYLSLKELSQDYTATISLTIEPFTMFIWIGALIIFAGTVYAMWPAAQKLKEEEDLDLAA